MKWQIINIKDTQTAVKPGYYLVVESGYESVQTGVYERENKGYMVVQPISPDGVLGQPQSKLVTDWWASDISEASVEKLSIRLD